MIHARALKSQKQENITERWQTNVSIDPENVDRIRDFVQDFSDNSSGHRCHSQYVVQNSIGNSHIWFECASHCCKVCAQDFHTKTKGIPYWTVSESWLLRLGLPAFGWIPNSSLEMRLGSIVKTWRLNTSIHSGRDKYLQDWRRLGMLNIFFNICNIMHHGFVPEDQTKWPVVLQCSEMSEGVNLVKKAWTVMWRQLDDLSWYCTHS